MHVDFKFFCQLFRLQRFFIFSDICSLLPFLVILELDFAFFHFLNFLTYFYILFNHLIFSLSLILFVIPSLRSVSSSILLIIFLSNTCCYFCVIDMIFTYYVIIGLKVHLNLQFLLLSCFLIFVYLHIVPHLLIFFVFLFGTFSLFVILTPNC